MISAILSIVLAAAQAAPASAAPPGGALRDLLEDCSAHRFEAVVSATVDSAIKRTRIKLCGTKGQSESEWILTLQDSADKIAANQAIAAPLRAEMVKSLDREIANRKLLGAAPAANAAANSAFTLKPRPVAPRGARDNGTPAYTSLPPLPPPVSVAEAAREIAAKPYIPPPPITRPDLKFGCFSATNVGEAECNEFDRFIIMVITARSAVSPGASLRFLRDGDNRAEIALGAMKKGQKLRLALPAEVCKGVNGGSLGIETWVLPRVAKAQPQLADTQGPYTLRC
ncbi:MAG: hypothetical protein ABIO68_05130 [Sphingomicrobium sp.]